MAEDTVTPPVGETVPLKELDAIHEEFLRGISLLQVLARAVAGMGEAELEASLEIAAEHFSGACNRMECALLRLRQE